MSVAVKVFLSWLTYRVAMFRWGASDQYIREAFSYLACLDTALESDSFLLAGNIEFSTCGSLVHLRVRSQSLNNENATFLRHEDYLYECIIKEGIGGVVYVDEWRPETRFVKLELGFQHETHWFEVYRSGKHIQNPTFVYYLRKLYGGGPDAI